jgi:hypothetical protein
MAAASLIAPEGPGEAFDAEKLEQIVKDILDWLSHGGTKGIKQIPHCDSDFGLTSADGTKSIRFDLQNSHGLDPHVNLESKVPRNLYPGDKKMIPDPR